MPRSRIFSPNVVFMIPLLAAAHGKSIVMRTSREEVGVGVVMKAVQIAKTFVRRARPLLFPKMLYSADSPADENALSLYEGEWTSKLPGFSGGGQADLFGEDERPRWMAQAAGGISGKHVLELGPLEGGHSFQLEQLGARVTAIEGNSLAFQRCLIVKNLYDLRTKFLHGDFVEYLRTTDERFDIVFASGVLYHMRAPVKVILDLCRLADQVFVWSQYFDEKIVQADPKLRRSFASGRTQIESIGEVQICGHERRYNSGWLTYFQPGFCGGPDQSTYWLTLDGVRQCFGAAGFEITDQKIGISAHGPHVTLMAKRRNGTAASSSFPS